MRRVTFRSRGARKAPLTSRQGNSLNQADRLLAVFLFGRPLPSAAAPSAGFNGQRTPKLTDHSPTFMRGAPALTRSADIKLNTRLWIFPGPTVARPSVKTFSGRRSCLKQGIGLMIRYSSYGGTNYRTTPSAPTTLLCSLEIEYRELQDLRERVRMVEAAAREATRRQTTA